MAEAKYSKTCEHCNKHYLAKFNSGRFCSKQCCEKARYIKAKCGPFVCKNCGIKFFAKNNRWNQYCTRQCASSHKSQTIQHKILKEIKALRRIAKKGNATALPISILNEVAALIRIKRNQKKNKKRFNNSVIKTCKHCKGKFTYTIQMGRHQEFCSKQCSIDFNIEAIRSARRICKARRRAVVKNKEADRIDPIAIFEIAKWTCHICGCKTPKKLRGTHKHNAPELDHIVTLAEGGAHTFNNVACACRRCNQIKSSKSFGQIKLF